MLRTITPNNMKLLEQSCIQGGTVTDEELMQCAARHVANAVLSCTKREGLLWCLCGPGNNGGDGLAAVRLLAEHDPDLRAAAWILPGKRSADFTREFARLRSVMLSHPEIDLLELDDGPLPALPQNISCVIDALFGTGLSRPLEGTAAALCSRVNEVKGSPVISVDIPSGLSGETGEVLGCAVKAGYTVTFHRPKEGLYLKQGPDYAGKIIVASIGLPMGSCLLRHQEPGYLILERSDLKRLLPPRKRTVHKGNCGRVLLWAGSPGMAGAAALCAQAALRTGAGLVTVACPETILNIVQTIAPCATCIPLPQAPEEAFALLEPALLRADAVGIGCGLGLAEETGILFRKVCGWLDTHPTPAVLDADALNLLAAETISLEKANICITPHPVEAARLLGWASADVIRDPAAAMMELWDRFRVPIVLKGARSLLTDERESALNPFGTPAMAKGGSGDVLTGVLCALLAGKQAGLYSMDMLELLQTACALHGLAGETAEKHFGERGVLATDLCDCLGLDYGEEEETFPPVLTENLGRRVTAIVEHPAGSIVKPGSPLVFPCCFGYVQQVLQEENRWQDVAVADAGDIREWYDGRVAEICPADGGTLWILTQDGNRPPRSSVENILSFWKAYRQEDT